jgi:hypothetical protein
MHGGGMACLGGLLSSGARVLQAARVVVGVQMLRHSFGAAAWLGQALARHGNQPLIQPRSSAKAMLQVWKGVAVLLSSLTCQGTVAVPIHWTGRHSHQHPAAQGLPGRALRA